MQTQTTGVHNQAAFARQSPSPPCPAKKDPLNGRSQASILEPLACKVGCSVTTGGGVGVGNQQLVLSAFRLEGGGGGRLSSTGYCGALQNNRAKYLGLIYTHNCPLAPGQSIHLPNGAHKGPHHRPLMETKNKGTPKGKQRGGKK